MIKYLLILLIPLALVGHKNEPITIKDLYSKNIRFTPKGEPLIYMGVGENLSQFRLKLRKPWQIGKTKLKPGEIFQISYQVRSKGKSLHWVILDRYPYDYPVNMKTYGSILKKYQNKKLRFKTTVVGNLSVINGHVIDIRKKLMLLGPFDNIRSANSLKERLYRNLKIKSEIFSELIKYPSGKFTLSYKGVKLLTKKDLMKIPANHFQLIQLPFGFKKKHLYSPIFRGDLYFVANFNGKASVTNVVPIEVLLRGIVPAEIFASAHLEALKSQAIAARTDILSKIGTRHFTDPFQICNTQHCQMYKGENAAHPRTNKAVKATYGEVLQDSEGLIEAFYSANSGCYSENNENVWYARKRISLRGRDDFINWDQATHFMVGINRQNIRKFIDHPPKCYSSEASFVRPGTFRWRKTFTRQQMQIYTNKYIKKYHLKSTCRFKNMVPKGRGISGRIVSLMIDCHNKKDRFTIQGELEIRFFFGYLKSSMFYINRSYTKKKRLKALEVVGGGWGHGVGMSQMGAIGMAEANKKYSDILTHYYTGTELIKLY